MQMSVYHIDPQTDNGENLAHSRPIYLPRRKKTQVLNSYDHKGSSVVITFTYIRLQLQVRVYTRHLNVPSYCLYVRYFASVEFSAVSIIRCDW